MQNTISIDKRLPEVLKQIEETRKLLVILESVHYEQKSGKSKEQIQSEIAETTKIFKYHLRCKHFLKGEESEEFKKESN